MSCLRRRLLALSGMLGAIAATGGIGFYFAAAGLLRSARVERADAVVVLAGDIRGSGHAADLFRQGYAQAVRVIRPVCDLPLESAKPAFLALGGHLTASSS